MTQDPFQNLKEGLAILARYFQHAGRLDYASIAVGVIVGVLYCRIIFRPAPGFGENAGSAESTPMEYKRSAWAEYRLTRGKILLLLFLSVGSGIMAYHQLPGWFPQWFAK